MYAHIHTGKVKKKVLSIASHAGRHRGEVAAKLYPFWALVLETRSTPYPSRFITRQEPQ